jgi:hypothetical protein
MFTIGNLMEMINYKITDVKYFQLPTGILEKLQFSNVGTAEIT